jgi:hypothetical protein
MPSSSISRQKFVDNKAQELEVKHRITNQTTFVNNFLEKFQCKLNKNQDYHPLSLKKYISVPINTSPTMGEEGIMDHFI